jgi:hypothetical protein
MRFTTVTLTIFNAFLLSASASTVHVKRSSEIVYLANCHTPKGAEYSEVDYYANWAGSQQGQRPNDACGIDDSGYITWEGSERACTFSDTGVTFTSDIASDAQSLPDYSYAGPGWNGYTNFNCYKDNGRLLYKLGISSCYSIYYCLDVSYYFEYLKT